MDLKASRELVRFAAIGIGSAVRRAFSAEDAERFLSQSLGSLPGAPAKIAQLMGMRSFKDIPSPYPMDIGDVKSIISSESPALYSQLDSLSEWARTASIGQTHQAKLKSGEVIAVKVQYPEVASAISSQIDAIFGVAGMSPAKKYDFDVASTRDFLRQKLLEETDYRRELESQNTFYERYVGSSIVVPRIYKEFSTSKILTQSWENSIDLSSLGPSWSSEQKNKASILFTSWLFDSMFGLGVMHSDLNPSNYGFRLDEGQLRLVVYDFGAVTKLPSEYSLQMYRWLDATRCADEGRVKLALVNLGFASSRLEPIAKKLLPLSAAILKPLLDPSLWDAEKWNLQESLDEILGQDKWWFRTAGPPWFMYLMRSVQGWHHALKVIGGSVDLQRVWTPWHEQLRVLSLAYPEQNASVTRSAIDSGESKTQVGMAKNLMVRVNEGSETIVELTLPAGALSDLEGLLPDQVLQRCAQDGIRLDVIRKKALDSGSVPQELFAASLGRRSYKVWLE